MHEHWSNAVLGIEKNTAFDCISHSSLFLRWNCKYKGRTRASFCRSMFDNVNTHHITVIIYVCSGIGYVVLKERCAIKCLFESHEDTANELAFWVLLLIKRRHTTLHFPRIFFIFDFTWWLPWWIDRFEIIWTENRIRFTFLCAAIVDIVTRFQTIEQMHGMIHVHALATHIFLFYESLISQRT